MNKKDQDNIEEILKKLDTEIHELYIQYGKEEDEDTRRDMRNRWRDLVREYESISGYNPYRRVL